MVMNPSSFKISARSLAGIALGIVAMVVLWNLRDLLMVIGVALVIAAFMNGPIQLLKRIRVPRVVASIIVYFLMAGIFASVLVLFVPVFMNEVQSFVTLLPRDSEIATIINLVSDPDTFKTLSNPENTKQTASLAKQLAPLFSGDSGVIAGSSAIIGTVLNVILTFVIAFYFSIEEHGIDRFIRLLTPREREDYVLGLWSRVRRKIELWFRGQVILACILGVLTYVSLLLLAVPYALLLSLLVIVLSIIPFGIVLATVPAVVISFLAGGLPLALIVLGIYIALQQIENHIFQPLFVKRTTGLPPIVVIIALAGGVILVGVAGLFIAVPVAVLLLELLSDYEKSRHQRQLQSE